MGSSSYITNGAGTISQHMEYLPFGETLVDEHINSKNSPFKFNGKEYDEETGNYYYGARYYDPKLSIFISVDPLTENYRGWSPYAYCANNPASNLEIDGRFWWTAADKKKAAELREIYKSRMIELLEEGNILAKKFQEATDPKKIREIESQQAINKYNTYLTRKAGQDLDALEKSVDVGYTFNKVKNGDIALLEYAGLQSHENYSTPQHKIIINYLSDRNATHEVSHAADYDAGYMTAAGVGYVFGYVSPKYTPLDGEVKAYATEFGVYGVPRNYTADKPMPSNLEDLNKEHIRGIYYIRPLKNFQQELVYPYKDLQ